MGNDVKLGPLKKILIQSSKGIGTMISIVLY